MTPTCVFQTLARTEPLFTVSSFRRYRKCNTTGKSEAQFWEEGRQCIESLFQSVGNVSFGSLLDYGCGVGRLIRYTSPRADVAYGVDICQDLLNIASQTCPKASFLPYEQWIAHPPKVDFSYSVIVFQHIPEEQGLLILDRLLKQTDKICAFHMVVADKRNWLSRMAFRLSFIPPFAGLSNWLRGRRWDEPRIPMFCWNKERILGTFERAGFRVSLHALPGCVEPFWENHLFVGRRLERSGSI